MYRCANATIAKNPIPRVVLQPASTSIACVYALEADNFDANSTDEYDE